MSDEVRRHFDELATEYDRWKERSHHYYDHLKTCLAEVVPPGRAVLEVGCATGDLLASLAPSRGVGVDLSPALVARAVDRHPGLEFHVLDVVRAHLEERFEHVLAVDVLEHVDDPTALLASMGRMLAPGGSVVVVTANPRWSPILHLAERLKLKMPEGDHVWRSEADIRRAAADASLLVERFDRSLLVPKRVPVVSAVEKASWAAPLRQRLGLVQRAVLRTA